MEIPQSLQNDWRVSSGFIGRASVLPQSSISFSATRKSRQASGSSNSARALFNFPSRCLFSLFYFSVNPEIGHVGAGAEDRSMKKRSRYGHAIVCFKCFQTEILTLLADFKQRAIRHARVLSRSPSHFSFSRTFKCYSERLLCRYSERLVCYSERLFFFFPSSFLFVLNASGDAHTVNYNTTATGPH